MSDITINLDGIIALLVSTAMTVLLALALIAAWLTSLFQGRERKERCFRQPVFTHVYGIAISLSASAAVLFLLILNDGPSLRNRVFCLALDNWAPLWAALILAFWPATWYLVRKKSLTRARRIPVEPGTR